jgi:hypothetical protein
LQAALNTFGVGQKADNAARRDDLREQFEPFSCELATHQVDARDIRTWLIQAGDDPFAH